MLPHHDPALGAHRLCRRFATTVCCADVTTAELTELRRTLREHGVDLASVADGSRLSAWERQLSELDDAGNAEAAA